MSCGRRQLLQTGTASPPYTRDMQREKKKKRRAFWRREEGGDWASVDEADVVVSMYGWIVVSVSPNAGSYIQAGLTLSTLPHSEGGREMMATGSFGPVATAEAVVESASGSESVQCHSSPASQVGLLQS